MLTSSNGNRCMRLSLLRKLEALCSLVVEKLLEVYPQDYKPMLMGEKKTLQKRSQNMGTQQLRLQAWGERDGCMHTRGCD